MIDLDRYVFRMVSFTGTRKGVTTYQESRLIEIAGAWTTIQLSHGCCEGADRTAHRIWRGAYPSCTMDMWPSNLGQHEWARMYRADGDILHPIKPPLVRDTDIVNRGQVLVATPRTMGEEARSGTWATIRYARRIRRPLLIIQPDGTLQAERLPEG